ncbi:transposase, partial [Paenibacillus borealis]|uniref:transposase n=1 Tax=Paenibacillus borealis TaxID=160799 RepID=UPI002115F615
QNPKLSKSIADASWGEWVRQLTYKASWYGRTLRVADTFEPTSQQCHVCGTIHPEVKNLSIREWTCVTCGTHHDRDENAAYNIKQVAVYRLPIRGGCSSVRKNPPLQASAKWWRFNKKSL